MVALRRRINGDWCTPTNYIDAVRRFFGGRIGLDPCSNEWSNVAADNEWLPPRTDGLQRDWDFATIFVHPPFKSARGALDAWLAKCSDASSRHDAQVVALLPASVNSAGWQRHVWREARGVCFIFSSRIRFMEGGHAMAKGTLLPCAFVYWGSSYERFEREFRKLGAVVDLHMVRTPGSPKDHRFWLLPASRSSKRRDAD